MHRRLWNTDHASFFSEATLIEIGVYIYLFADVNVKIDVRVIEGVNLERKWTV